MKKALFLALLSMISVNAAFAGTFEYNGVLKLENARFTYPANFNETILKRIPIKLIVNVPTASNIINRLVVETPTKNPYNDPCKAGSDIGSVKISANLDPSFTSTVSLYEGATPKAQAVTKSVAYTIQEREEKDWDHRATDFILNSNLPVSGFTPLTNSNSLLNYDFNYENSCGTTSVATLQIDAIDYSSTGKVTSNGFEISNAAPKVRVKYSIVRKDNVLSNQPLFIAEGFIDL